MMAPFSWSKTSPAEFGNDKRKLTHPQHPSVAQGGDVKDDDTFIDQSVAHGVKKSPAPIPMTRSLGFPKLR